MTDIIVLADTVDRAGALQTRLSGYVDADYLHLAALDHARPAAVTVLDIDLRQPQRLSDVKDWLDARPPHSQVIVGVDTTSFMESTQAYALGATALMQRPLDGRSLLRRLGIAGRGSGLAERDPAALPDARALRDIFAAAAAGEPPQIGSIQGASAQIVDAIAQEGLSQWLDVIRSHHSQTYRHCLTVTALAVAFGRHLGFGRADTEKMASAGLLHDIGKARIPIEILEKPAPLDDAEAAVMQKHAELGYDILRDLPDLHPQMLDMVLHHHEYLDGSGYPHGLRGTEISDLVRLITIADVYGALIERRAYKAPLSGAQALDVLMAMGQKLDRALVGAFAGLVRGLA